MINPGAEDIATAVALLRAGNAVAIPTETVYGLAAVINRPEAIERIFQLKKRPFFDPLIVHVENIEQVALVAREFSPAARRLAEHFWPGPLTLVLPRRSDLNAMICAGLDTVAVRAPAHPVAREILRQTAVPLAAPSANIFSKTSATSAEHVRANFSSADVFVVDAGPCDVGIESTVVEVFENDQGVTVDILRPGIIGEAAIKACLPNAAVRQRQSTASPGSAAEHYRPAVPLVIVAEADWPLSPASVERIRSGLALGGSAFRELRLDTDAVIAARQLYSELHRLGAESIDFIAVVRRENFTGEGWTAIWDRLGRAASLAPDTGV